MGRKSAKSLGNQAIAVAYIRVSTEEQHLGPEAQRRQIEAWAAREKVSVVAWHADQGISGAAGPEERPGLAAALYDVRARRAGRLVVAKRDRLARDVYLAGAVEKALAKDGARLVSADGAPTGDSPAEVMQRQIGDVFAQYERSIIAARTKAALAVKKARGEACGNIPYGWQRGPGAALVEHPGEQSTIAAAAALRARGVPLRGIASLLDLEGFKTRTGTAFTHVQVRRMLRIPRVPRAVEAETSEAILAPAPAVEETPHGPPSREEIARLFASIRGKAPMA
jgi:DNA invertase Pin-like site-specific DNA recombinase